MTRQPTISDGRLPPVAAQMWDAPIVICATTEKPIREMISANSLATTVEHLQQGKVALIGYHVPRFIELHADPFQMSENLGIQLYHQSVQEFLGSLDDIDDGNVHTEVERLAGFGIPCRGDVDQSALPMQARHYLRFTLLLEREGLAFRGWLDLLR